MDDENKKIKIRDEDQPKWPLKLGLGMFISSFVWYGPMISVRNTLLPAYFEQIDPQHKVWAVGLLSVIATFTAAVVTLLGGALSDITRTKFGRRTPYIITGTILMAVSMMVVAHLHSATFIIGVWVLVAIGENLVCATSYPIISDFCAPRWRPLISTFYGVGNTIAQQLFIIIASFFLNNITLGIYLMSITSVVMCVIQLILIHEPSNLHESKIEFNKEMCKKYFMFPTKGAKEFYLALGGKFVMQCGGTIVSTYLLYLFTDYYRLNGNSVSKSIAMYSFIGLIIGTLSGVIAGPLASKINKTKGTVQFGQFLLILAPLLPMMIKDSRVMFAFAVITSIGGGIYNSVDTALNLDVLPDCETAGKDLGIINLANTLSQVLGAIIASTTVTVMGYHTLFMLAFIFQIISFILISMIKSIK